MSESIHIVTLTESLDGGESGTGRVWVVDEATWQTIVDYLPDEPHQSVIYTPEDLAAAEAVCDRMLTYTHGDSHAD